VPYAACQAFCTQKENSVALNELVWFTVEGYVYDVEQPAPSGTSIQPSLLDVSAYVDFFPGNATKSFQSGFVTEVLNLDHGDGTSGNTMVPLAPITARLLNGALCAIVVGDPIGQELLAGAALLNLALPLYYHVRFRNVTYGGATQAISNFAFLAPTGADSPTSLGATPSGSGGSLAAGTYRWGVTAVTTWGETALSNLVSETLSGSTSSVALAWTGTGSAIGYNVYRGPSSGSLTTLVTQIGSGGTVSYTDTGAAGSAVTPPSTDTLDITSPTLVTAEYGGP
jgi:hypothetical protein